MADTDERAVYVHIIAERVIMRLAEGEKTQLVELDVHQATLLRDAIGRAVRQLETGSTVASDYPSFRRSLVR